MAKYLYTIGFLLFWGYLSKAQPVDSLTESRNAQYRSWDFIGCIETSVHLLQVSNNKGEVYYYKAMSEYLLGDYKSAVADMKLASANGYTIKDKSLQFWMDQDEQRKYVLKHYSHKLKIYPELGYRPRYNRKDSLRGALRTERSCFDVTYYNLNIKIDPSSKKIGGYNEITFKVMSPTRRIQLDLFPEFKIGSITWNNKSLVYTREFNAVFVTFPIELSDAQTQTIRVNYSGKPIVAVNPPWEGGFVWKKDTKNNWWCGVACEQLGASCWWPNKDHPSDEPDSMQLTFSIPNGYDVVSNGRLRAKKADSNDFTSHTWFVANPINNYDATFYLGKFAHFSDTMSNVIGKYPLDYYVMPFNVDIAKKIFAQTKDILKFYESAFGVYPFMTDKFSLVEAPFEGMEHQSAIAYGNGYDKSGKSHTFINRYDDYIIVHETAHEWWGNSVTACDMADIWIQEGFATYAELMFLENKYGKDEYLSQTAVKMKQIFNLWPIIQNYNVNEDAFLSNDCYNKGATTLHNLRCCINNDSLFFRIVKDFALKYRHKIVTTQNFIDLVNEYTDQDYTAFFKKFLYDTNLPVLKYSYRKENGNIYLRFHWDGVEKDFKMPFCISSGNKSFRLEGSTTDANIVLKNAHTFRFFTPILGSQNVEPNSFTYFWTSCTNFDN